MKENSQKLDKVSIGLSESKYITKLLSERSQKLDRITEDIHPIELGQTEILARLDLEKRVRALEKYS